VRTEAVSPNPPYCSPSRLSASHPGIGRSRSLQFRYAANTRLREAAMWWAFNSVKTSPWAAAVFRQARDQRGQRYHRPLPGLAARWARILWRCWVDRTTYDPQQHRVTQLVAAA
jgi:hypothetical protein